MWEQVTKHSYFHLKQTYFGKCKDRGKRETETKREGGRERKTEGGRKRTSSEREGN
jgi:hypothetical protein